jgi:hypothetical protein
MTSADIPSPEVSGNSVFKKSYVYAIAGGASNAPFDPQHIKIGRASDPVKRFRQIQTSHPQELRLFHREECKAGEAAEIEREAHSILAHQRQTGEWFKTTMYEAQSAICCAADRVRMREAWEIHFQIFGDPSQLTTPRTDAAERRRRVELKRKGKIARGRLRAS